MSNNINFTHRRSFGLYEEFARWRGNVHDTQMQKRRLAATAEENEKDRAARERAAKLAAETQIEIARTQSETRRVEIESQERVAAINAKSNEAIRRHRDETQKEIAISNDKAKIETAELNYRAARDQGLGVLQLQYDTEDRRKREAEEEERQGGFVRDFHGQRINGVYEGEYLRSIPHGKGNFHYDDNRRYVGQFAAGRFEGWGDWYDENGILTYSGEWAGGRFNGKGRLRIDDDRCFVGTFRGGQFRVGIMTSDFNAEIPTDCIDFTAFHLTDKFNPRRGEYTYEGKMTNGKPNGRGIKTYEGGDYDEGVFIDGKAEGLLVRQRGRRTYMGDAKDDLPEGDGQLTLEDGSIYVGQFRKGLAEGEGRLTQATDSTCFTGSWRQEGDALLMKGSAMFPDGRCIEGEFRDRQLIGTGICHYPDGYVFEGTFADNRPLDGIARQTFAGGIGVEITIEHGRIKRNTTTYPDGATFTGSWRAGEWRTGILRLPDGSYYSGEFQNFKRHGLGLMVSADGTELDGEWRADRPVK